MWKATNAADIHSKIHESTGIEFVNSTRYYDISFFNIMQSYGDQHKALWPRYQRPETVATKLGTSHRFQSDLVGAASPESKFAAESMPAKRTRKLAH